MQSLAVGRIADVGIAMMSLGELATVSVDNPEKSTRSRAAYELK